MRRFVVAVASASVSTLVFGTNQASADAFNLCNSDTGCVPDNFDHTYCYSGTVDSNFRTAISQSMANLDAQSSYFDTFVSSCSSLTDAQWQQTTAPGGSVRGDYLCLAKNSANECERARLRLNPNLLTDAAIVGRQRVMNWDTLGD